MTTFDDKMKTINRRIGQKIGKSERGIARQYARALTEIRAILAAQYERYEKNGELPLQEMLKFDRLKKMMQQIDFLLQTRYRDIAGAMEQVLGEVYLDGYYLTAWAVESEVKANLGYASVRPESLTAMLANPVAGLTLTERLEKQRAHIIYEIQQQVTQGLQSNESYATMAKRLKEQLEGDAVKAMRIVRTEGHRVQESAKHDAAEHAQNNGVVMLKEWNSQEDERVRRKPKNKADHRKLNNTKIPIDGEFYDGLSRGKAPGQLKGSKDAASNINCRCFLTYSVEQITRVDHGSIEAETFERWKQERIK